MKDMHISYPTITEAICDFHFHFLEGKEWEPSLPEELFKHIQDDYPEMESVFEMGLQLESRPAGTGTTFLPQSQKVRFKHRNRPLVLQFAENSLSVSTLFPYQGWKRMREDVLSTWRRVEEILHPVQVDRVGLRYINAFKKEDMNERLSDWLVATEYIPEGIVRSESGYFLRSQSRLDTENVLMITLGDVKSASSNDEYGSIIFDIDRIAEKVIAPGTGKLEEVLEQLHEDVREVFFSAKGEKLENLLHGGQNESESF